MGQKDKIFEMIPTTTAENVTLIKHPAIASQQYTPTTTELADSENDHNPPARTALANGSAGEPPLLLNVSEAAQMCGVSVTTLWRLVAKNVAPPPVYPTPRSARWKRGDLVSYVSSLQPRKRRSGCLVKAPRNAAG